MPDVNVEAMSVMMKLGWALFLFAYGGSATRKVDSWARNRDEVEGLQVPRPRSVLSY